MFRYWMITFIYMYYKFVIQMRNTSIRLTDTQYRFFKETGYDKSKYIRAAISKTELFETWRKTDVG